MLWFYGHKGTVLIFNSKFTASIYFFGCLEEATKPHSQINFVDLQDTIRTDNVAYFGGHRKSVCSQILIIVADNLN